MKLYLSTSVLTILFCLPLTGMASTSYDAAQGDRNKFVMAERALREHQWKMFHQLAAQLQDYPLYPYLMYEAKKQQLSSTNFADIQQLKQAYPNTPLLDPLQEQWLRMQAQNKNWKNFLAGYSPSKQPDLQCHAVWAKYQLEKKPEVLLEAKPLWLVGTTQSAACDPVFEAWDKTVGIEKPLVWERIHLAIKKGNETLVYYLSKKLPIGEQSIARLWLRVKSHPALIKDEKLFKEGHPFYAEIRLTGLERMAIKNAEEAAVVWEQIGTPQHFNEAQRGKAIAILALHLAQQHSPLAKNWLNAVPESLLNDTLKEWKVRTAIRRQDWAGVLHHIAGLTPAQQNDNAWQYWLARGYQKTNHPTEAQAIYKKLAQERNYYGFMASKILNQKYRFNQTHLAIDPSYDTLILSSPNVKRALELKALKRDAQARREWLMGLSFMSESELIAASRFADSKGFHDWSVMASSRAQYQGDLPVRFPLAYQQNIFSMAKKLKLDPAWLFAITRQESAFKSDVRSPTGALGLMQLMPTTAQHVAKKNRVALRSEKQLIEPAFNIQLGSQYLRSLYEDLNGHTILATAAYNAGPTRIRKWLPDQPLDADAWIETIPFQETRHYVKNVITYYSIYRELLGQPHDLGPLLANVDLD